MKISFKFLVVIASISACLPLSALPYQLALSPPANGEAVFVEITVPPGAVPAKISHDGVFDSQNRSIKWGPLKSVSSVGFDLSDGSGTLAVSSEPANATNTNSISRLKDTDGDGLSDEFESTYGVNSPGADPDGDGFSNLEEQNLGTDPLDASSQLFVSSIASRNSEGKLEIQIPAEIDLTGLRVEATSTLKDVLWRGVEFTSRKDGEVTVIEVDLSDGKSFFRVIR